MAGQQIHTANPAVTHIAKSHKSTHCIVLKQFNPQKSEKAN